MAQGWQMRVDRIGEQTRGGLRRTIGHYQVFHDGVAREGLVGWTAEAAGPGDNQTPECGLRIAAGVYPLAASSSDNYATIGYLLSGDPDRSPKPCLGVENTGARTYILIHPGVGFRVSTGCINLASELAAAENDIPFADSRDRVLAVIADLRSHLGGAFPRANGQRLPGVSLVIAGEP